MYVNDLLLVDLVEITRGSACISRGVILAYIVFAICCVLQVNFLSRAFRNLKKNTGKPSYRKLAGTSAKKNKKTKNLEVSPHN